MLALFFSSYVTFALSADSPNQQSRLIQDLAQQSQWKNLLHAPQNSPHIADSKFLLSAQSYSAEKELKATLDYFASNPKQAMCRFPARYLFISRHIDLPIDISNLEEQCPQLAKFISYVPFDQLSLIYASEELASATSMMGHIFLRAHGKNFRGNQVEHSIAFFTEINTFNPATLIYTGTISGMNGLLLVKPYATDAQRYSKGEGRNLWQYNLSISPETRQLIQFHLWELKQANITYLFQSYNCATLTLELLALANPDILDSQKLFVSPIDVVKAIKNNHLINGESVLLASPWKLNMLQQQLDPKEVSLAERMILDNKLDLASLSMHQKSPLLAEYLETLIQQPHIQNQLSQSLARQLTRWITDHKSSELSIDLSQYKNPAATKQDAQWGIRTLIESGSSNAISFNFVPASHQLYGDNSQYFSESSLKIGEITINAFDDGQVKLDKLSLYDVEAYTPTSLGLPVLSGSFYIGYHHIQTSQKRKGTFEISASAGKTYQLTKDISFYSLLGAGIGIHKNGTYGYLEPKIGTIINLVSNSKLIVEHNLAYNRFYKKETQHHSSATLSWYGATEKTFYLSLDSFYVNNHRTNQLLLGIDFHF